MEPIVRIKDLSYRYPDGTQALNGISLDIFPGEKVGIIGANGAGKSTLLLHLNGLLFTEGAVEVGGIPLTKKSLRQIRRKVGIVFQSPDDQLFCPTLYDDVAFGPRNMRLSDVEIEERVRETLNQVGLDGKTGKGSFHLSFGEKRRAALASVLAMRPELLALDEPTSGLDPKGKSEIISLLQALGGTQVIVTHDIYNLPKLAQRAVLMAGGEIIADAGVEEILGDEELLRRAELV